MTMTFQKRSQALCATVQSILDEFHEARDPTVSSTEADHCLQDLLAAAERAKDALARVRSMRKLPMKPALSERDLDLWEKDVTNTKLSRAERFRACRVIARMEWQYKVYIPYKYACYAAWNLAETADEKQSANDVLAKLRKPMLASQGWFISSYFDPYDERCMRRFVLRDPHSLWEYDKKPFDFSAWTGVYTTWTEEERMNGCEMQDGRTCTWVQDANADLEKLTGGTQYNWPEGATYNEQEYLDRMLEAYHATLLLSPPWKQEIAQRKRKHDDMLLI